MTSGLAPAFAAGVAGTAAMMAVSAASRSGVMAELTRLAGAVTSAPGSRVSRPAGVATQLLNGGLFATAYRTAFDRLERELDWRRGAAVGLAHGVAAGLFLGLVPVLHPRVPDELPPPGAFMLNRGTAPALAFVALHVLFGAVVGTALRGSEDDAPGFSSGGERRGVGWPASRRCSPGG